MKKVGVIVAAFAIVAVGGIAYAAIPGPDGVIHGCFKTASGDLRVINTDAGDQCRSSESAIEWSQEGPQGEPGLQGPQGPQGPAGEPATALWAAVSAGGALLHGSHVANSLLELPVSNGRFRVTFDRDVSQCAYLASLNSRVPVYIGASSDADNGNPADVIVEQSSELVQVPYRFSLAVFCKP